MHYYKVQQALAKRCVYFAVFLVESFHKKIIKKRKLK